jgi:AraC-like DNA-binding protein
MNKMKISAVRWGNSFYSSKGKHYRKSLVLILLIASIPGLITGALIYWFVGGRIENELLQLHKSQIAKRAESIDGQFAYMELAMSHWAFEPKFDFNLKETDFYRQFPVTRDITKTMVLMQGAMPLADRLDYYLDSTLPVHFSPEFNLLDKRSTEWTEFKRLLLEGPNVYWTAVPTGLNGANPSELALVQKMPGGSSEPFGLMLARMDHDKVIQLLKTLAPYDEGESLLMQEDGTQLVSTEGPDSSSPLIEAVKQEVLDKEVKQTSFLFNWNKNTYSVSFGNFERIGSKWIYVSVAPISVIKRPIVFLSQVVFMISGGCLLLAALLAWFASRRIYSPLDRIVRLLSGGKRMPSDEQEDEFKLIERQWQHLNRESHALQDKLKDQLPQVKEGFLLQLIQGYLSFYSEEALIERVKQYSWPTEDRQFIVLYVQLTGMMHLDNAGRFSLGDEGLVTFAAANMIEELAGEYFTECHVVNFHDLTVGLMINLPQGEKPKASLYQLSEAIIQSINRILQLQVTITIGKTTTLVKQIPILFEEAKQALSYRSIDNDNQIMDLEILGALDDPKHQGFHYPFALERDIIQAMRMGQEEEAALAVQAFLEQLTGEGAKEMDVQQGVMNLLGSLEHAIMHAGLSPNQLYKSVNMFEQLSALREPKQIKLWLTVKVIRPFIETMENRADYQIKRMIEQAMLYIQNNYSKDISLDNCAEHCGTNAFVLSRSFKQVSGKNFIDYLTDLRLDNAKEQLRGSEQKISEIAEQVGYQHSYFNRIFKKYEGVTPSQYREMSRNG